MQVEIDGVEVFLFFFWHGVPRSKAEATPYLGFIGSAYRTDRSVPDDATGDSGLRDGDIHIFRDERERLCSSVWAYVIRA
jgi:hypothetical protein